MNLSPEFTYGFFLILIRTASMLVSAPLLSHRSIPAWMRIGFAVFFSLVMVPVQGDRLPEPPAGYGTLAAAVLSETLLGLGLGMAMQLIFIGLQMGSHIIGLQMGFSLGAVFDPVSGSQFGANDAPVALADSNWTTEDAAAAISGNVLTTLAHNGAQIGRASCRERVSPYV